MQADKFYQLGHFIYRARWWILILTFLLFAACIPLVPKAMKLFSSTGFVDPSSESAKSDTFLKENLNYHRNQFIVMYTGKRSFTNNSDYMTAIRKSLAPLKDYPIKSEIVYPDDNKKQIAENKKSAYALVALKSNKLLTENELRDFRRTIKKPSNLSMKIGGEPVFLSDTNKQTQKDLIKAEYIATPVAIITLLIVFGTVMAAFIPMLLDGLCAVFILSVLACIGFFGFSLSVFTLNIALLLGLCLSLDYALFIINRFRDELKNGNHAKEALAITLATAGKAVFFSGLAVFASLSALLFFPINVLFSVGVGGITAVGVAVFVCVVVLPAFLAVLKAKINFLPVMFFNNKNYDKSLWMWLVTHVVKHPWRYFIAILLFLLLMGWPFLTVKIGISDYRILPQTVESRMVFDTFHDEFNENQLTPIVVTIKTKQNKIITDNNVGYIYDFVQKLKKNPDVYRVDSIVTTDPQLKKNQYQMLYTHPDRLPAGLKQLLKLTTNDDFTVVTVVSKHPSDSPKTKALVEKIRDTNLRHGLTMTVTGQPVNTIDVLHTIKQIFPLAFVWVIVFSYVILLVLLRSIFLPVKAILTNMLSLFASYGLLVTIIQKGYLASVLNFQPQGMIDISLLIIIFCALFGFSMDYEVFLLSRIKEYYEQSSDNIRSICYGITHSSRIITSAAIVVILICFSFISADILLVKAFGLGIAIAIFVDAFLIRTILVPAVMTILGPWNWYLPKWLDRILPKLPFNIHD